MYLYCSYYICTVSVSYVYMAPDCWFLSGIVSAQVDVHALIRLASTHVLCMCYRVVRTYY